MRIRVAHVNQSDAIPARVFQHAAARKLAWITGIAPEAEYLAQPAEQHGYRLAFDAERGIWLAVREDLIVEGSWVPSTVDGTVFAALHTTVPGLGEIIVSSGDNFNAEEVGDTLGVDLVFYGGTRDGELGFGFYDAKGRIQKLKTDADSNDNYLEAVISL